MAMQSSNLLPALQELPGGESNQHKPFQAHITDLVNMDRAMYAAEFASAASFGMWFVFDERSLSVIQVPDGMPDTSIRLGEVLQLAYEHRMPEVADQFPDVHDKYQSLLENGDNTEWLNQQLKGQLAEFNGTALLEQQGHSDVHLAPLNQKGWDISSKSPEGEEVLTQEKIGDSHSYTNFRDHMTEHQEVERYHVSDESYPNAVRAAESMQDGVEREVINTGPDHVEGLVESGVGDPSSYNSDYPFQIGSQIHDIHADSGVFEQIPEIGADYELVEGTTDGLNTLTDNLGIDVPEGVVDIIPYAAAIVAGARLIYSVIKTEKEFKEADRTTKNKLQVVQTLALMSRMGPKTVLSIVGGKGGVMGGTAVGGLAGTVVPGVGNAIGGVVGGISGGIAGVASGYWMGRYLGKHLEPHMLNLALKMTGLTNDDLFYYKNKTRIDTVALSFQSTARELAAASA